LFYYLGTLHRWRKFLLINIFVAGGIAAIVSLLLPVWYKSSASIMSPKEQDLLNPLGAASSLLRGMNLGRRSGSGPLGAYNFLAILNSRTAMDSVVRRFDLIATYDVSDSSMEKTIRELRGNVAFQFEEDDYISIEVEDRDPVRAADMANYFVEVLNTISIRLGTLEASENRKFIERRLAGANSELARNEDSLRAYQEKVKMIIVPEQDGSGLGAVADLYAMKAKKEIELAILEKSLAGDDPSILRLKLEIGELDNKLESFPEIGLESLRLYRDVLVQQKIVEILLPLYEQARVDEQKDVPALLVIDTAVPAEKKSRPQRMLIVLFTVLLTSIVAVGWVFFIERIPGADGAASPFENSLRRFSGAILRVYRMEREREREREKEVR
jgi:uncharacterized protein involved in exopolysaccharide biosynthesis